MERVERRRREQALFGPADNERLSWPHLQKNACERRVVAARRKRRSWQRRRPSHKRKSARRVWGETGESPEGVWGEMGEPQGAYSNHSWDPTFPLILETRRSAFPGVPDALVTPSIYTVTPSGQPPALRDASHGIRGRAYRTHGRRAPCTSGRRISTRSAADAVSRERSAVGAEEDARQLSGGDSLDPPIAFRSVRMELDRRRMASWKRFVNTQIVFDQAALIAYITDRG
ncbi:hypothetical protein CAPTEDRAFT_213421 [Capitella teleta]|uniref:Uncharacterized protein n=1 Tax=Capitella teleta TaxID=283909 RepID=R7UE98_CAPTE|nr:hypothetical protein CAPTEDRAFT_213421 [Capitella teleta]|eukprot:ELU04859.1 hypothetical protein CAPTEDRAFT_213421 [Capitella teleta]